MTLSENDLLTNGAGGEFSDFERLLRQRPLGTAVEYNGELLYRCGYAAGMAAASRTASTVTNRWRLVGLAAAAVACLSLGLHGAAYLLAPDDDTVVQASSPSAEIEPPAAMSASGRTWSGLLAQQRPRDGEQPFTLRASTWRLRLPDIPATIPATPLVPDAGDKILQPNDYDLLLQGEL